MKRIAVSCLALVTLGGLLVACGDDSADEGAADSTEESSTTEASGAEFNDADIEFVEAMIPHHEGAITMAEMAADRAVAPEVKDLASRIAAAQGPEIETMQGWLEEWGVNSSAEDDGAGMDHGDMSGDMGDGEMAELEAAQGEAFDEMFLTMMIEHHQGAVDMANSEIDDGLNADAIAMARDIIAAQEAEIEEMQGLLESA